MIKTMLLMFIIYVEEYATAAPKELYFSEEAKLNLSARVNDIASTVQLTLGPKGSNMVLKKKFGAPTVTKDGTTVASEIELIDQFGMTQVLMTQTIASNNDTGDGTTTATVTSEMIYSSIRRITAGSEPMQLKRGISVTMNMQPTKMTSADGDREVSIVMSVKTDVRIEEAFAESL